MSAPLASICMPNLNGMRFLRQRLDSFFAQTINDWELIVCDGFSDDGSWEYLQSVAGDSRIRLYQMPRRGVTAAINFCLERATGEYVYIAPADDTACPDFLELLTKPLRRNPSIHIAVCDYDEINADGATIENQPRALTRFLGEWSNRPSIRSGKTEFLLHAALGTTAWCAIISIVFRRALLNYTGYLPEKFNARSDEAWTLRASLASDVAWVPGRHASFRRHAAQLTQPHISANDFRVLLESLTDVIYEDSSLLPASWRQVPRWDQLISAARKYPYWQARGIGISTALRQPRQFSGALLHILREDPAFLAAVIRNKAFPSFAWTDRNAMAMNLIRVFQAEWPPRYVEGGW